jgi:hypothetical protein
LAEASSLVSSNLRKFKFYPPNLLCGFLDWCFWYSGTSGTSGTLVFWYFVKLGFHFPEDLATEKVRSRCQIDPWGRAQLSRVIEC